MPIDFSCDDCDARIRVPDGSSGKKTKCPKCQKLLLIPASSVPAANKPISPPASSPAPKPKPQQPNAPRPANPNNAAPNSGPPSGGGRAASVFDDLGGGGLGEIPPASNPYDNLESATLAPVSLPSEKEKKNKFVSRQDALDRVYTPAWILMTCQGLAMGMVLISMLYNFLVTLPQADNVDAIDVAIKLASAIFMLSMQSMTLTGLGSARSLQSKRSAWTGLLLTMIPCCSNIFWFVSFPVGIWLAVLLLDNTVNRFFRDSNY